MLRLESGTSRTVTPDRFHQGRVVGGPVSDPDRVGVGIFQNRAGESLRRLCPPQPRAGPGPHDTGGSSSAASFSVSLSGTAGTAPSPCRAHSITRSITERSTNGRAPSCTSTTPHSGSGRSGRLEPSRPGECRRGRRRGCREPRERGEEGGRSGYVLGRQYQHHVSHIGMGGEATQRPQHDGYSGHKVELFRSLAAEPDAPPRGDYNRTHITRQARAPADPRGPAPRATRRAPAPGSGRSRIPDESPAARLPQSAARPRHSVGSHRPARSRPEK